MFVKKVNIFEDTVSTFKYETLLSSLIFFLVSGKTGYEFVACF